MEFVLTVLLIAVFAWMECGTERQVKRDAKNQMYSNSMRGYELRKQNGGRN